MHELAVAQPSLISLKQIPIVRFKAGKPYRSMPGYGRVEPLAGATVVHGLVATRWSLSRPSAIVVPIMSLRRHAVVTLLFSFAGASLAAVGMTTQRGKR